MNGNPINGTARHALYFAPSQRSAWWRFGARWLGRCAASGLAQTQPRISGLGPAQFAQLTAAPRRYGFHGTLKAPFRLADGMRPEDLVAELDAWCRGLRAFALPPMRVAQIDDFLALIPARCESRIDAIAAECVARFDHYRAPLGDADLARRHSGSLAARELAYLQRWGYPHVFEAFRFHLSLTGPRGANEAVRRAAQAALPDEPLMFDAVCFFQQSEPGADFRVVHRAAFGCSGRLVYLVGPSGSGKDSVLEWVRANLPRGARVAFARRTVTRAADAGGEEHVAVTPEEFDLRRTRGEFAICWGANGNRYGIGREIHDWLSTGMTVVVSGSREYLPRALAEFPRMEVAHVTAPAEILRLRLERRGREGAIEVAHRLARAQEFALPDGVPYFELNNDEDVSIAGRALLEWLLDQARRPAAAIEGLPV